MKNLKVKTITKEEQFNTLKQRYNSYSLVNSGYNKNKKLYDRKNSKKEIREYIYAR